LYFKFTVLSTFKYILTVCFVSTCAAINIIYLSITHLNINECALCSVCVNIILYICSCKLSFIIVWTAVETLSLCDVILSYRPLTRDIIVKVCLRSSIIAPYSIGSYNVNNKVKILLSINKISLALFHRLII